MDPMHGGEFVAQALCAMALVSLPISGCRRATSDGSGAPTSSAAAQVPAPTTSAAAAGPVEAPDGYVTMTVMEVAPTDRGDAVLLVDGGGSMVVPIFVGGTEALSIRLRLDKQKFQRPLTHDLLDALLGRLGGELQKVHVDDIKGNVFVGTVFVRQRPDGKAMEVDARPSDAIALALGNGVPIFVSRRVIDATGIRKEDLQRGGERVLPGRPSEPMAL